MLICVKIIMNNLGCLLFIVLVEYCNELVLFVAIVEISQMEVIPGRKAPSVITKWFEWMITERARLWHHFSLERECPIKERREYVTKDSVFYK